MTKINKRRTIVAAILFLLVSSSLYISNIHSVKKQPATSSSQEKVANAANVPVVPTVSVARPVPVIAQHSASTTAHARVHKTFIPAPPVSEVAESKLPEAPTILPSPLLTAEEKPETKQAQTNVYGKKYTCTEKGNAAGGEFWLICDGSLVRANQGS